jgi:hypothetical protein
MRALDPENLGRWARAGGLLALAALAWAVLVPGGAFWSAVVGAGVVGTLVATSVLVRSRSQPSLAQVIATAEADSVALALLRSRGEGKP